MMEEQNKILNRKQDLAIQSTALIISSVGFYKVTACSGANPKGIYAL